MIVGCGEWGFREMPMEQHFQIAQKFGFKYLEFGIGGGQTGRLPEQPTAEDIASFRALGARYDIRTPFCCIENDFTKLDAAAACRVKKPSPSSNDVNARPPKPAPTSHRNWRRVP